MLYFLHVTFLIDRWRCKQALMVNTCSFFTVEADYIRWTWTVSQTPSRHICNSYMASQCKWTRCCSVISGMISNEREIKSTNVPSGISEPYGTWILHRTSGGREITNAHIRKWSISYCRPVYWNLPLPPENLDKLFGAFIRASPYFSFFQRV